MISLSVNISEVVTVLNCDVGFQVRRGPDWYLGEQDAGGVGTILNCAASTTQGGIIRAEVIWGDGGRRIHRISDYFDLAFTGKS